MHKRLLIFVVLFVLSALTTVITLSALSDGKVKYCYIENVPIAFGINVYRVVGHREWRTDRLLATTLTFSEAEQHAQKINCNIQ